MNLINLDWKKIIRNRKNLGIALGLITILLGWIMPASFVENVYSRGLYVGIRYFFVALNSWWPFAGVYLLIMLLLVWLGWLIRKALRAEKPFSKRLLGFLHGLLGFAGWIVFLFQWLWGFNYGRVPLEARLGIDPRPLSVAELRNEFLAATTDALRIRQMLQQGADTVLLEQPLEPNAEERMRNALKRVLIEGGYPIPGDVRARTLWPKGVLLRFGTAGVYLPFTGEGHVDDGLHHLQRPFVLAHEMSHAYGFGDEGSCNFLAYIACTRYGDPYLQYIGYLYYWRYVASEYLSMAPSEYEQFKKTLHPGLRADVRAINEEMDKYPDIMPAVRDAAYNTYLQSQGISEGMKNYDRVVMLVAALRQKGL